MNVSRESRVSIPRFELYELLRRELERRGVLMPKGHEDVSISEDVVAEIATYVVTWREAPLQIPLP